MNIRTFKPGSALALVAAVGLLAPANLALAGSKGRKNTAIGLGAAAAHQLLTGKTRNAVILGAGAAYAYKRYKDAEKDENRNRRAYRYRSSRNAAYRSSNTYGGSSPSYSRSRRVGSRAYATSNGTSRRYRSDRYGAASPYGAFVFTGRITDDTDLTSRRILVTKDGIEHRVDVPRDAFVYQAGERASIHDLREGDLVRVTAARVEETRWRATRIDVLDSAGIDDRPASARRRSDVGIDDRPVSSRRYSGVGIVRNVDEDGRSFDVRVGDNLRRVYTSEDARFDGVRSVSDLRIGDRVRVRGDMDGDDVVASEVTLLD